MAENNVSKPVYACKKNVKQFNRFIKLLGKNGGLIKTTDPDTWWDLTVETEWEGESCYAARIGVFRMINGDPMFSPIFYLSPVTDEEGSITALAIDMKQDDTFFGTFMMEPDGTVRRGAYSEKVGSIKKDFSEFMSTISETGPYLKKACEIISYDDIWE